MLFGERPCACRKRLRGKATLEGQLAPLRPCALVRSVHCREEAKAAAATSTRILPIAVTGMQGWQRKCLVPIMVEFQKHCFEGFVAHECFPLG